MTEDWTFANPALSEFNSSMILFCRKMMKHHCITQSLKAQENIPKVSVEDSIFDAFLGGDSREQETKKEEKEEKKGIESLDLKIDSKNKFNEL